MHDTGRTLHANLHLLDRQIVDRDGRLLAKVDDLELDLEHDPPVMAALLSGPQAWGPRLPGLLGRLVVAMHRRLHPDPQPGPVVIPASFIMEIDSAVTIAYADQVNLHGFGDWVDQQFISRIPGANDETQ